MSALFDVGLQPERTQLAWRRTGLAFVVGSLAAVRLLPELVGGWGYAAAALGLTYALAILVASHLRYRRDHLALTTAETDRVALSGGALVAVTALAVLVLALAGAGLLVALALR